MVTVEELLAENRRLRDDNARMRELIVGRLGKVVESYDILCDDKKFKAWTRKWVEDFRAEREMISRQRKLEVFR